MPGHASRLANGMLGIAGVPLPFVETGIAVSVVVLGLAIAAAWRAPVGVALAIVALFGVFHAVVHGQELPEAAAPAACAAGFVVSTGLLHLGGIATGLLQGLPRGGLIAAAGVWLLAGMPGVA